MKTELLTPDTLTQQLKTRRHELLNLLNLKMKSQKNLPQGHLRIEQKKGARAPQFYHFTNPADTHGVYIPAAKQELARRLAQKDYDHKLIKILEQQLTLIEKLIKVTEGKITGLYTKSCVRTRQEFIWEHFGMMDSPAYASRTVSKLKVFSENNILPGKNLIITMETADLQLSSRQVENLIKEYLE